jgi:biopolymer transport protein ExbB
MLLAGFATVTFLLAGRVVSADSANTGSGAMEMKYFDFFVVKGGWIAYLIILLSVIVVALTIEYCISIRRATIVPDASIDRIREMLSEKRYVEAIEFTGNEPVMISHALHAGLREAANGYPDMERAVEEAIDDRSARYFRKIEPLNIIGNVSPMLGLFGTVVGMILLFAEIHASEAFPPAQIVADKVAIALITTFWGLAVAIPALSIHAVFRNRIDVLTAECSLTAEELLSVFKPGRSAVQATAPARDAPVKVAHAVQT